jgi:hypothetical protein
LGLDEREVHHLVDLAQQVISGGDEAKSREELLAELKQLRMENAYLKNWRP